ncbi:RluA family pseudouridine synthase, partial [bacterium]|nr:RluA family pseudouridine synthase [bacterium]
MIINNMQTFSYTRHDKEETIIDFLVRRFPYQDKESWFECIKVGSIKINDKKVAPHWILKSKDIVGYERQRSMEPEIDDNYNILFLDDFILVVEKSGNIPVSESGRYYKNTLLNILKEKEGYPELFAVHRLDKETSGVILIARTKEVATTLGEQFVKQIPEKLYHAVLIGECKRDQYLVEQPLKKCTPEQSQVRIRQGVNPEGKISKTSFIVEKAYHGLTLAKIKTYSGRTHQIRCHAEYIGYPILGDKLYGQTDDVFLDILKGLCEPVFPPFGKIDRQLLHASSLSFLHPETKQKMTFMSDYS